MSTQLKPSQLKPSQLPFEQRTPPQITLDPQAVEAFGQRVVDTLNGGCLTLMLSIGHRTGLFDRLAHLPAATSAEIAGQSGLDERYVREWLGAMVAGKIVRYDAQAGRYWLPPEHAAVLTRSAESGNLASTAQWVAVLGEVESEIVDCFRNGGGVPYTAYSRFHEVMAEESAQTVVAGLLDHILPLVPDILDALRDGIDVLDVGCGSGQAMNRLAREFPRSRFTGVDFSPEAVATANREAQTQNARNARFLAHDAAQLEFSAEFDLVTAFDAIHDQAAPDRVLRRIHAALRPGGTFLMQDIAASSHVHNNVDHPLGALLYTISCMHCMSVSLAQGGAGLGAVWGEELAVDMLRQAGFHGVRVLKLPHDIMNNYYISNVGTTAPPVST